MSIFTALPPIEVTFYQNMIPDDATWIADPPHDLDNKDITIPQPNSGITPILEVRFGNLGKVEGQMQIEYVFVDYINAGATIELWENGVRKAQSAKNTNGNESSINSAYFSADFLTDKTGQSMRIRFVGGFSEYGTINRLKALRLLAYVDLPTEPIPEPPSDDPFSDAKTDWTPSDYYNHTALNRVENMIKLLKPKVQEYSNTLLFLHDPVLNRTQEDIPFAEDLYLIERDTAILGAALNNPFGFISPKTGWTYNSPFTHEDANRLENNLVVLNHYIKLQLNARHYCGQYIVGDKGVG